MDANRHRGRRLSCGEPLESRLPMAGDVDLFVSGANLRIVGDSAANDIAIVQTAAGAFSIVGNDGESFKLDGNPIPGPVAVTGVTKVLTVVLGGGDDTVSVRGLAATTTVSRLSVFVGSGADSVSVETATFSGSLAIETGNGDNNDDGDTVSITGVTVAGSLSVETGAGSDTVTIDGVTARQAGVNTAVGDDTVSIAATSAVAFESLLVSLGFGSDSMTVGSGTLSLSKRRSLFVGGPGNDTFIGQSNIVSGARARLSWGGFEVLS